MKNYAIYACINTKQQSKNGLSLVSQIEALKEYAKEKKLQVSNIFTDDCSTRSKRDGLNNLLNELSKGKFQGIICQSLNRLSRDEITFWKLHRLIAKKGIEIVTLNGISIQAMQIPCWN